MNDSRGALLDDDDSLEDLEIELLLTALARRFGYDFRQYASGSLKRRIRRVMQLEQTATISALQDRLLHQPDALKRFVAILSVHVTAMFRDPPFYRALRTQVVPILRSFPFVRIWQAGCSSGEEVYSLAILLEEEGLYDRCRIYATDMSDELLERCRRGSFPLSTMRRYTANYLAAGGTEEFSSFYTADHERAVMKPALKRNLVFSRHNLVSDGCFNEFQMVLCRNVLIYFDRSLQQRVHKLLADSLVRFGLLGLGMRETLSWSTEKNRFESVDDDVRLYRRIE